MLKIDSENRVILTRGDTARFLVSVKDASGEPYEIRNEDEMVLTVKKSVLNKDLVIRKVANGNEIVINPEDTVDLKFGAYIYDVQLTLANGDVNTIIPPTVFILAEEVSDG